jgi:hypothetical protein
VTFAHTGSCSGIRRDTPAFQGLQPNALVADEFWILVNGENHKVGWLQALWKLLKGKTVGCGDLQSFELFSIAF